MKKLIIKSVASILIVTVCATIVFAKTLIVSDIDDTIKISNVNSIPGAIEYAPRTKSLFLGMPSLYKFLGQNVDSAFENTVEFAYVSLAPKWLMEDLHRDFLRENHFPRGRLFLRELGDDTDDFKLKTIRKLLKKKKNNDSFDQVIFFGDNSEADAATYSQIAKEFKDIKIYTFIRQAYSVSAQEDDELGQPLEKDQIGFVSPLEVLLELESRDVFKAEQSEAIKNLTLDFARKIIASPMDQMFGELAFPIWVNCSDFKWQWTVETELLEAVKVIRHRCQNEE
jgi:phosphatidate phosphatase APP1